MISKSQVFSENFHQVRIKSTVSMKTLSSTSTTSTILSSTTLSSTTSFLATIEEILKTLNNFNFILLILILLLIVFLIIKN